MIGWVQQCMWEEWHASDVMQHREHPAQRWLGSRWHRPIAAVVWGSRVGRSPGEGLVAPSLKEWVNPVCRYARFHWLPIGWLVGCPLRWTSKRVGAMAPGPQSSIPSCPRMSSMTKPFHALKARRGEEEGEGIWRDAETFVRRLTTIWVATSPPMQQWIPYLESARQGWCHLNGSTNKISGGKPACIRSVENQRAVALAWGSDFIHSTRHDVPW